MSTTRSKRGASSKPGDHSVGYGRPPAEHQFKPGQSGNPRGRPKGAKNESTLLYDLLHRKVEIRNGRRTRKITVLEVILWSITESALKDDTKSAGFLLNRYNTLVTGETHGHEITEDDDRDILEDFARRLLADQRTKADKP